MRESLGPAFDDWLLATRDEFSNHIKKCPKCGPWSIKPIVGGQGLMPPCEVGAKIATHLMALNDELLDKKN